MRVLSVLTAATMVALAPQAASSVEQARAVTASIIIDAPPHVVWEAVADQRRTDPDLEYSKILSRSGDMLTLEQKFTKLPVIGSATAVINALEKPHERIDYTMVRSDRFKSMHGSWVLTPLSGGRNTRLELSSHLDTGLPFSRLAIDAVTRGKIKKRLHNVKNMAEAEARRLAARGLLQ